MIAFAEAPNELAPPAWPGEVPFVPAMPFAPTIVLFLMGAP
jgi:hypothetical protein